MLESSSRYGRATRYSLSPWAADEAVIGNWARKSQELVLYHLHFGENGIDDSRSRISLLDLANGESRVLAEGDVYWPGVSMDGSRVTFTRKVDDSLVQLVVASLEPWEERVLLQVVTDGPRWPLNPTWGPRGEFIYYTLRGESSEDPGRGLWRIAVTGGTPEPLSWATEEYMPGLLGNPGAFHPLGGRLALVTTQNRAEVWVMEDFLPPKAGEGR